MRIKHNQSSEQSVDISPLIDMVFILLIFFMVSTTFVKDMQLDLERPGASSAVPASSKAIRVFIDQSQKIYIDGQEVRPWVLQSKIREFLASQQRKGVLVVTDKGVPAEKLLSVVDHCRLAGAKDIGVATEQDSAL